VRGLRLATMPIQERELVAGDVLAAYEDSLATFARLGADVTALDLPFGFSEVALLNGQIMSAEAYSILGHLVENDTLQLDEDVSARICAGRSILARDYLAALSKREQLKRSFDTAFCGIDALLTPTTASVALPLHLVDQTTSPAHFTRFANFLDLCAIALPNGFSSEGLPTSLQLIAHGNDEEMLLRIAWAYQNATDWHTRRPANLS
jgi:aspartyl-tRNA(Asn)/glutamyl-tRNA(Gln) amidotransferase subunit A